MLLTIIIVLIVLIVWTWTKWETVSPKLLIRETAGIAGVIVGATPELARTTVKLAKAANATSELAIRESGQDAPVGFRGSRRAAHTATREFLQSTNDYADKELSEANAALAALKS